ncbi:hypothetical protein D915_000248 [Fasciola hepatica]|uniref:Uncharacterized protein n=1 Tax=Fasciola hepatica TaxID=6192 RepID=A0A4E0S490_FASHE|nr:hypothetical protein D915_000248 [Fasciola hepatica]
MKVQENCFVVSWVLKTQIYPQHFICTVQKQLRQMNKVRAVGVTMVFFLVFCHSHDTSEPSYEHCMTEEERSKCEKWGIRRTLEILYRPTGGFPANKLQKYLAQHCYLSPTCLALQLKCLYTKLLKKKVGICGDRIWHQLVRQSRDQFEQLPEPLLIRMEQLNPLIQVDE